MTPKGWRVFLSRELENHRAKVEIVKRLQEAGLEFEWGTDALCCEENDVHVVQTFDSDDFYKLQAAGANVIGIACALACLRAKPFVDFPRRKVATCCTCMNGVKILCSGFTATERAQIRRKIEWMNGNYVDKVSHDPDFIIARDVTCQKYRWAVRSKKPVVGLDWLSQCWSEHRLVSVDAHRLACFTGLRICTTGIKGSANRAQLQAVITQNGGEFMAELERSKSTHLVAFSGQGQKYFKAKEWEKKVVSPNWIWQSVAAKECLPEENFMVPESSVQSDQAEGIMSSSRVRGTPSETSTEAERPILSALTHENRIEGTFPVGEVSGKLSNSQRAAQESLLFETGKLNTHSFVDLEKAATGEDVDDMYLSACRIHLVGFNSAEEKAAVRLITAGGGTRFVQCNDSVTHVVVSSLTEGARTHLRRLEVMGTCNIVWATWLRDSVHARQQLPVEPQYTVSFGPKQVPPHAVDTGGRTAGAELLSKKQQHPELVATDSATDHTAHGSKPQRDTTNGWLPFPRSHLKGRTTNEQVTCSAGNKPSSENMSAVSDLGSCLEENQMRPPAVECKTLKKLDEGSRNLASKKLFEGCTFGFEDSLPAETQHLATETIRKEGGCIFEPGKGIPTYTIGNHGNRGAVVKDENLVSYHWLVASVHERKLLDPTQHIIYRPLTCDVPLPGFTAFTVCVSLYGNQERELMRNLSFCLGAKVTEKLTKRVTHLLCPYAQGEKCRTAITWGIQVVTVDWLFACVAENRVVSSLRFQPREPISAEIDGGEELSTQYPTQAALLAAGRFGELGSQWDPSSQVVPSQNRSCSFNSSKEGPRGSMSQQGTTRFPPPLPSSSNQPVGANKNMPEQAEVAHSIAATGRQTMLPPRPSNSAVGRNEATVARSTKRGLLDTMAHEDGCQSDLLRQEPSHNESRQTGGLQEPRGLPVDTCTDGSSASKSFDRAAASQKEGIHSDREYAPDVAAVISKVLMHMQGKEPATLPAPDETCNLFSPESTSSSKRTSDELDQHLVPKRLKPNSLWRSHASEPDAAAEDGWTAIKEDDDYERFQESQAASQTVSYEEDMSARRQLIEKIQLNSRKQSEEALGSSAALWPAEAERVGKGAAGSLQGLQGLLRAADANK